MLTDTVFLFDSGPHPYLPAYPFCLNTFHQDIQYVMQKKNVLKIEPITVQGLR